MTDMKNSVCQGHKHPKAKLTPANVRSIRKTVEKINNGKSDMTKAALAESFGVSYTIIRRIEAGTAYKNVV